MYSCLKRLYFHWSEFAQSDEKHMLAILHSNREKPCGLARKRRITMSDSRICLRSHPFLGMVELPLCTLPMLESGSFAAMTP
jgi:hypothetical protein